MSNTDTQTAKINLRADQLAQDSDELPNGIKEAARTLVSMRLGHYRLRYARDDKGTEWSGFGRVLTFTTGGQFSPPYPCVAAPDEIDAEGIDWLWNSMSHNLLLLGSYVLTLKRRAHDNTFDVTLEGGAECEGVRAHEFAVELTSETAKKQQQQQ